VGGAAGTDGGEQAGAAGDGGDGGEGRTEIAYVSTLLGGLMQLSLAPTGEPSKLVKEPIDKGQTLIQVAVDVDEHFVYAVNQDAGRIRVYPIGADGALPVTATSSISLQTAAEPPAPISPITFALDPLGRYRCAHGHAAGFRFDEPARLRGGRPERPLSLRNRRSGERYSCLQYRPGQRRVDGAR
jgi:hypothetical protein